MRNVTLVLLLALCACTEEGLGASRDGGADAASDGAVDAAADTAAIVDAQSHEDLSGACTDYTQCDDGVLCTFDDCVAASCTHTHVGACEPCTHARDCDDGDAATLDRCETGNFCVHAECFANSDCDDGNACTSDSCAGRYCSFSGIPGCGGGCTDFDHDGDLATFCGGTDCDPTNASVFGGAAEVCDDGVDNDCDRGIDYFDVDCLPPSGSCDTRPTIEANTPTAVVMVPRPTISTSGACGYPAYHNLVLATPSDVDIEVHIEEMPLAVEMDGSPSADASAEYLYGAFLERVCGDATTHAPLVDSDSCQSWSPFDSFFMGPRTFVFRHRGVAAGTYSLAVLGEKIGGAFPYGPVHATVTAHTRAAATTCVSPTALTPGSTLHATTSAGVDAFAFACLDVLSVESPESLYTFTLTERRLVRVRAEGEWGDASFGMSGMRLGVYPTCDTSSRPLVCNNSHLPSCQPTAYLDEVLDAGTYFLVVEGNDSAPISYSLHFDTLEENSRCAAATPIVSSGTFTGDTTGSEDSFNWHYTCGNGSGPDRVYEFTLDASTHVAITFAAAYDDGFFALLRDCDDWPVASGERTSLEQTLAAGTYRLVVDGTRPESYGSYALTVAFGG